MTTLSPPTPSHITELAVSETDPVCDQIAILQTQKQNKKQIMQKCNDKDTVNETVPAQNCSDTSVIHTLMDIFRTSTEFAESDAVFAKRTISFLFSLRTVLVSNSHLRRTRQHLNCTVQL